MHSQHPATKLPYPFVLWWIVHNFICRSKRNGDGDRRKRCNWGLWLSAMLNLKEYTNRHEPIWLHPESALTMNIIDMLWISERKFYLLLFSRGNFLSGDETDFGVRFLPRFWPGVLSWASHQALRTSFRVQSCLAHNVFVCSMMVAGCCHSQCVHDIFGSHKYVKCPGRECRTVPCHHLGWNVNSCIFI